MPMLPLLDEPFLRAQWDAEFLSFHGLRATTDASLRARIIALDSEIATLDRLPAALLRQVFGEAVGRC
jgi:hypothetical protein